MIRTVRARRRALRLVSCCAVAFIGFASLALAQDKGQAPDPAAMEAQMKAMTPGPHHAQLAKRAGTWKTSNKMWMQPDQPPMLSEGSATTETLMDGRFSQEINKGNMMGMPFEGRGITGYDNTLQKHVGVWFDSFGTMMMQFEGTCDGTCTLITTTSYYLDPMSMKMKTMKTVTTMNSEDEYVLLMYDVAKDGTEFKMAEIKYMREAGSSAKR